VREGILKHAKGKGDIIAKDDMDRPSTREAEIVRVADVIAYINHDIDDAIRGHIIGEDDLPKSSRDHLGRTHSSRIDTMVRGVIGETLKNNAVSIGEELENRMLELRDFLYERVYESEMVHEDFKKCTRIVEDLYTYFLNNPEAFLEETGRAVFYDEPSTCICDYIAGMTDRYAFTLFEKLFLPMPWKIPV
jgi:dGTPase